MEHIYKELLLDELKQILKRIAPMIESEIDLNDIVYKTQLMKTQFGSCIPKKRIIKLNSILARFPKRYLEAILIHEIIHLKVHNHQKDFYRYVNRWIPNYRTLKQELNKLSGKYVI